MWGAAPESQDLKVPAILEKSILFLMLAPDAISDAIA